VAPRLLKNLWTLELHNEKLCGLHRSTSAAAIKEKVELNLYSPRPSLGLRGLFWGELYIYPESQPVIIFCFSEFGGGYDGLACR